MAENYEVSKFQQPPEIIVLGPPAVFRTYSKEFSSRFRLLKPWESPLPLPQFLEAEAQNTQAALFSGVFSLSSPVLRGLPSLRLVVTTSAGLNHMDLIECRRRGISVANAATIFSADVADLAVGLLLDVLRRISAGNRFVKNGIWSKAGTYPLGFKVCITGFWILGSFFFLSILFFKLYIHVIIELSCPVTSHMVLLC